MLGGNLERRIPRQQGTQSWWLREWFCSLMGLNCGRMCGTIKTRAKYTMRRWLGLFIRRRIWGISSTSPPRRSPAAVSNSRRGSSNGKEIIRNSIFWSRGIRIMRIMSTKWGNSCGERRRSPPFRSARTVLLRRVRWAFLAFFLSRIEENLLLLLEMSVLLFYLPENEYRKRMNAEALVLAVFVRMIDWFELIDFRNWDSIQWSEIVFFDAFSKLSLLWTIRYLIQTSKLHIARP